ncbi:MAG TPA: SDR family oxidoreductase [Rubrobacter sp.]|nr:SDR family oxidoreductase [Rubrobacter sp.]
MELGLGDKVAIVTAGSQGIGKAIAEELAREGVKVSICARGKEDLEQAAKEIGEHGPEVLPIPADATEPEDVQRVVDETVKHFGHLDILVNNAGGIVPDHSFDTSDEEWRYATDLNLNSAIRFTRAVVPHMRAAGGGRIINNASVSAHTAMVGGFTTYEVTKTAMLAFSKSMAIDLAPDNILVNCVCPALILTPLWEKAADSMIPQMGQSREEVLQSLAEEWLLLKRCGRPEEVGALVAFLASERASFITGSAYDIDGGFTKSLF